MNASRCRGFVLVSSIWLTLLMLFFAGLLSYYASAQLDRAAYAKKRYENQLDFLGTEQTLIYLLATRPVLREGIKISGDVEGFIRVDGEVYEGLGDTCFSVTDYAGLVGLNTLTNYHLATLLEDFESSELVRDSLLHSLYDYIDLDDFAHLNGGEDAAYRIAKLSPPTNDYLRSPVELRKVIHWSAWLSENTEFDVDWLSTNWRSRINLNAVPVDLFNRVLRLPTQEAERLLNRRTRLPFENMEDVASLLNFRSELDDDYFTFLPSDKFRLRICSGSSRKMNTLAVRFTPLSMSAPWKIEYRYQSESEYLLGTSARSVGARFFHRELSPAL